jgi:(2Fe-2S) ferredoxin
MAYSTELMAQEGKTAPHSHHMPSAIGCQLFQHKGDFMPKPKYHILVCTNSRPPGHPKPSCGSAGAAQLLMAFNMGLMQRAVPPGEVLVSATGCLGPCEQGPTVVVYPDNTWYSKVTEPDVATILDEHVAKGTPAAKLNPDSVWK